MNVVSVVENSRVRIVCSGVYGIGSEGNPSAQLVRDALEDALQLGKTSVLSVTVDYTEVRYEWGDGPIWSLWPAVERALEIEILASHANAGPLRRLFTESGFGAFRKIRVGT